MSPPSAGPPDAPASGHAHFMGLAIAEALKGRGRTHPNPSVGAVIVKDGRVVGRGWTRPIGQPHAEVVAIADAGEQARGADLYVTLEPCNHFGRTPPCTDAILGAGIRRVFVGSIDANPLVAGGGLQRLREQDVEVFEGVRRADTARLAREFFRFITTGRPWITLKAAATLDGRIATRTGDSRWVSGEAARRLVHQWRDEFDAVLVGAGTVRADDPLLTTRLDAPVVEGRPPRHPVRVVLDGTLTSDPAAKVFDTSVAPTLVLTASHDGPALERLRARGVVVETLPASKGEIDPRVVAQALGRRGLTSVLVEGGGLVHAGFLGAGVFDELRLFLAPKVVGDGPSWLAPPGVERMADATPLRIIDIERIGEDLLVTATPP